MRMMTLPKENLMSFLEGVRTFGELHAPLRKGEDQFVFGTAEDPDEIAFGYNRTILPVKKYFVEPVETLFTFTHVSGYESAKQDPKKRIVIFGVHPCDIHGMKILDLVFGGRYGDDYYFSKRERTAIIGVDCIPDDSCFCRSTGTDFTEDGFDLFLCDLGDSYLVRVGTSLGDDMLLRASTLFRDIVSADKEEYKRSSARRIDSFTTEIHLEDLPEIMDLEYESKIWEEIGSKCLSCGTCSMVCPTCYCYDVFDELNLDACSGQRLRRWDSCLFKDYALVAGGHDFRPARAARIKNRFFHKQRGFVAQFGRPSCVGCGRCIVSCPADISIADVMTKLRSESYA